MKAIAAMAADRVIGIHGRIPWKCSLDMRFFKAMTVDHPVIVGRHTFESTGILKDRFHYVISERQEGKEVADEQGKPWAKYVTVGQLFKVASVDELNEAWVIGGAKVYQKFLPMCSDLYLTVFADQYEGDTYMPSFEHLFNEQRIIYEGKEIMIVHYWLAENIDMEHREPWREGFDAKLMGKTHNDNPYEPSGHPRDTTYEDEQNFQWYSGFEDAPNVRGLNYDRI
jgi:dihydrofolate reductase